MIDVTDWYAWYAWFPVRLVDGGWAWLEPLERKQSVHLCFGSGRLVGVGQYRRRA